MRARPETVDELRTMFKDGATPSRLIRHIAECHKAENDIHALIQDYFWEAFGIPIVRGLRPKDDRTDADLHLAFLNEQLVHEMIQHRSEWDRAGSDVVNGSCWLDSVVARDDEVRFQQAQATIPPELGGCWVQLSPKEQQFIQRSIASANGSHETVKILARLAESLQQQLTELEHRSLAGAG